MQLRTEKQMLNQRLVRCAAVWIALSVAACVETPPGETDSPVANQNRTPERVAPGIISTDLNETFPAEDPLDGSLWFSRYEDNFSEQSIWVASRSASGWEPPEIVSFSGRWGDRAPRFSPDGRRLYFTSNRPVHSEDSEPDDVNIWVVTRRDDGSWAAPELVPAPVSLEGVADMHVSMARGGAMYWASRRQGGAGNSDIYRTVLETDTSQVEHLGEAVNDSLSQPDLLISPDETWMVLVITDHPDGLGGDDLYVSRRQGGTWSIPEHLEAPVNTPEYEYGPSLSRDGQYLYFTSHRRDGTADVYRMEVQDLGLTDSLRLETRDSGIK